MEYRTIWDHPSMKPHRDKIKRRLRALILYTCTRRRPRESRVRHRQRAHRWYSAYCVGYSLVEETR